jgi:hypothetical protein
MMLLSKRIFQPIIFMIAALFAMQTNAIGATRLAINTTKTTATTTTSTTRPAVKWHPGHYIMLYSNQSEPYYFNSVLTDLTNHPKFQGVQKQYFWNKLEPQYGVYDFSEIQSDLANLAKINKRLILRIQAESFITYDKRVPYYLQTSEYQGGVYMIDTGKGYNAAYYNTKVQIRMIALVQALGKAFDANPNLEMINLEETSPSKADSTWNATYLNDYINGMLNVAIAARKAFPTTVVDQFVNYPASQLPQIFNTALTYGIGVGGPDTKQNNTYLISGVYAYQPQVTNILPISMTVDYSNYESSYAGNSTLDYPSVASIHQFAGTALKSNYLVWLRRTAESNGSNYWGSVLKYIDTYNWQADPSGGINTKCPTAIAPCKS